MRNKLHNCKNCMWSGACAFENTGKVNCRDFTTTNEGSYMSNEYNQALQERNDDYMLIVKDMCDELYDE